MPTTDVGKTITTDMTSAVTNFSVDTKATDGPADQDETFYDNTNWTQYFGYYKAIPELRAVIDAKATWTVGKGFKARADAKVTLEFLNGWGVDTFNTILENMIRTYNIGGDAFCEIILDKEGNLINLKSLDPSSIRIVVNRQGMIKRYEQTTKTKNQKPIKFKPEQIFHLCRNRVADEIHGVSMVESLVTIILMRNEAMADMKKLLHRNVAPIHLWHIDSDDTAKIAELKTQADKAVANVENIIVPKGTVEHEIVAVPTNATLNPLPWIDSLNEYFYEAAGVPKIIIGSSRAFTEASAKIGYLAFQQTIEEEQLYIEEEVWQQLYLRIELEFPATIENELISDKKKDGAVNIQPNEVTAGAGQ